MISLLFFPLSNSFIFFLFCRCVWQFGSFLPFFKFSLSLSFVLLEWHVIFSKAAKNSNALGSELWRTVDVCLAKSAKTSPFQAISQKINKAAMSVVLQK